MSILTPEEIGDNLDLEVEATYPCSDGSKTTTVSVDKLLNAQLAKVRDSPGREKVAKVMYYNRALKTGKENWEAEVDIVKECYLRRADKILSLFDEHTAHLIEDVIRLEGELKEANEQTKEEIRGELIAGTFILQGWTPPNELPTKIEEAKREERERIEEIIDSFMAHGEYKVVTEEGLTLRCSGADVEYIWNQIKQALKEGK